VENLGGKGIVNLQGDKRGRSDLLALTSLRGVAALWVILFHLRHEIRTLPPAFSDLIRPFIGQGYLGVDLFFVLSGFVITYNYAGEFQRFDPGTYARFMIRRFARIYPTYLAALLLTVSALGILQASGRPLRFESRYDLPSFIQSVFMVQSWTFPIEKKWNVPDWSVSAEWLAYLLFPAALALLGRTRKAIFPVVTSGLLLLVNGFFFGFLVQRQSAMAFGLIRILFCFLVGLCLARSWQLGLRPKKRAGPFGLALPFFSAPLFYWARKGGLDPLALAPIVFACVIFLLAQEGQSHRGFSGPFFQWLGRISYALYLVHGILVSLARGLGLLDFMRSLSPALQLLVLCAHVSFMVGLAALVHRWVEEPCRVRILKWLARASEAGRSKRGLDGLPS
jgi:peptidoglycan/LPS O-acetylase OafA/YrhL